MTNKLSQYLKQFSEHTSLQLVGPLIPASFSAQDPVVFVDGGAIARKQKQGITVGDGDSTDVAMEQVLPRHKNYSDFAYVLEHIPTHFQRLQLAGFIGGRKDHELINYGELHHWLAARKSPASATFAEGIQVFSAGDWPFDQHGEFSLLSLVENQITLRGHCQYPLNEPTLISALSSHTLSNVGSGRMQLSSSQPIFVVPSRLRNTL